MPRVPAPVVSSALSGFVVGVALTLLATGTISHTSSHSAAATPSPPPVTLVSESDLRHRIGTIVSRSLGPMTADPKKSRLLSVTVYPAGTPDVNASGSHFGQYRSAFITFQLDDHPFGRSWRLRAAKADVFAILRALYTSQLFIYDVDLAGKFPLDPRHKGSEQTALRAYIAHERARNLPWRRLGRADEERIWRLLNSSWVDPRFG